MASWAPPEGVKKLHAFISPETDEILQRLADLEFCSKSSLISRAVREYVQRRRAEVEPNGGAE